MSAKHGRRNRLVPPEGFVELHLRSNATVHWCHSAVAHSPENRSAAGVHAAAASYALAPSRDSAGECGAQADLPELGGLGVVRVPTDGYMRGSLAVPRQRSVFQTSTAARIRAYYEAMPEASQTHRLVPPSVGKRPSLFNTPLLREALKFALSAGGAGLSQADQMSYVSVLLMAERGARASRLQSPHRAHQLGSSRALAGRSSDEEDGEIARTFPTKTSFVTAVRAEQRRVLSKLC